ncbi:MAG: hypothetical protein ACT4PX_08830 [Actinomycetota bacterium]
MTAGAAAGSGSGDRTPLERAVELLVYAPLGLVLTAREELPGLIAKGREGAGGQMGMARIVGQFAVHQGQREAGKLLRQASERLARLGLVPDPAQRPGPATGPPSPPAGASPAGPGPAPAGADGASRPRPAGKRTPDPAALAIPGYDSLSAHQVVQRLDGLSAAELESVRAYEAATRGRKTILGRITQLQSGS